MTAPVDAQFIAFQEALAGRYSLERELGRGGMGIVYLAREVRLDRLVAIKVLPPELAAHEPMRERFLREARTAAGLSHPHIIPIYAVDELGDFVFYAMAYVAGETLAHRVAARGPVPSGEACRVLRDVAWALAYAHEKGIVHRDVKPENIMLEAGTGRALVADFGIARLGRTSGGTGVGEVIGTPAFMSPEQASAEAVDGRSDMYSLGVVAYYALSARLPFEAVEAHALLAQHLTKQAPPLPSVARGVPSPVVQIVERCLAKSPDDRFESSRELAEAIDRALEPVRELPPPLREFVRLDMQTGTGLGIVAWPVLGGFLWVGLLAMGLPIGDALWGGLLIGLLVFAGNFLFYAYALRGLLRAGYRRDDLLPALKAQYALRLEERLFSIGTSAPGVLVRYGFPAVAYGGLGAAVAAAILGRPQVLAVSAIASFVGAFLAWGGTELRKPDVWLDRSYRIWRGFLGRWLFRLAAWRLRSPAGSAAPTNRPTEVAIGLALGDLYRALPDATRRELAELPAVTARLEQHAQDLRGRLDQLDRLAVEAAQAPRVAGSQRPREAALEAMRAARAGVEQQRVQVVAALEALRLGLLRLHAGAGTVDGVTADLAAARELGPEVNRLTAMQRELDGTLAPADLDHA